MEQENASQLLDAVSRFLQRSVAPHVKRFDQTDTYPTDIVEAMREMGLFGCTISTAYGGLGLNAQTYAKIIERIAATWMALSGIINSHLIMAWVVERNGTEEQKQYYLPRFATGELRGGIALTEPDAGTDLQAIRTRAILDGDTYHVNGSKTWITNSKYGNTVLLLVKTDPHTSPPHKGMSLLIAEKRDGFIVRKQLKKLGYHSIDTCELGFEDYKVPASSLLGGIEGKGLQHILNGLELGRINVAARGAGIAKAALDMALSYAKQRKTFNKPIAKHQAIQLKLADMATRYSASAQLIQQAASQFDSGQRCDLEAGMAKYFSTETAMFNALECMRIHGAYGYSKEFDVERLYRDAPLLLIGEGTNELQRIIISRQLIERSA